MIKYFSVKRMDYSKSKNGILRKDAPFSFTDINDIPNLDIPVYSKLLYLAEQYIAAKNVDDMTLQAIPEVTNYLLKLKHVLAQITPSVKDNVDETYYLSCDRAVDLLFSSFNVTPALVNMFEDYQNFKEEYRVFPKEYIIPFLKSTSHYYTSEKKKYHNAIFMTPKLEDNVVVYTPSYESYCSYDISIPEQFCYNHVLHYMMSLNWTGKSYLTFLDLIGRFAITGAPKMFHNRTLSHFVCATEKLHISKQLNYSEIRGKMLGMMNYLFTRDKLDFSNLIPLQSFLKNVGINNDIIKCMTKSSLTGKDVMQFTNSHELAFLKDSIIKRATEAVDDDPDADEDEFSLDDDSTSSDMDTSFDEENNNIDTDTGMDDSLGDMDSDMDNSFGSTDDMSMDDSFGSDSGSDLKTEQKEDEVPVPDDPFTSMMKVVNSETFDDYLTRNSLIVAINAVINDPPAYLTADTCEFLKVWVTQWISLVSVDTTKEVLSTLNLNIQDLN